MKKKLFVTLMAVILVTSALTACGSNQQEGTGIPYPDNYYIPRPVETDSDVVSPEEKPSPPEVRANAEASEDNSAKVTEKSIHFFLDTSGSMRRSPEVIKIHSAATKCAAGYKDRYFYGLDSQHDLVETTEQLALSGKYGSGAPLDLIEKEGLPYDPDGVNVITTDLQSDTSCIELGRWLVKSGCTGFSFYVFTIKYDGSLEFETYTSNSTLETVSISNCAFDKKEFLMIVFGNDALVKGYDSFFKSKIAPEIKYDSCHVSLHDTAGLPDSFLKLTSSKCFTDNVTNVDFNNTNFVFGLRCLKDDETDFTCDNTFVYAKSNKSYSKAKSAVKAILYALPSAPIPGIEEAAVTEVLKYNEASGSFEDSDVIFQIDAKPYLDGFPSVAFEYDDDPEAYERLDKALGGAIVPDGPNDTDTPVFVVTVKNESLPEGLYAVEAQIIFEATGEVIDLQKFAASHTAGLEDYTAALQTECEAQVIDGQPSTSRFTYSGNAANSIFRKLLEFERVTDELIAAGAVTESSNEVICLRLIIDNRKK